MDITKLSLYNFRNFAHIQEIALPAQSLLIAAAPNATGKTNFLESLVVLLRGKSWRASHAECVRWGEDVFVVQGEVITQQVTSHLAVHYQNSNRRLRVEENGEPASPVTFYGHYPLVMFLPEDTFMFARGPAQRRNFLNRTLISSPQYVGALVQYQRALKQRNQALKTARSFSDVQAWTDVLVEYGLVLWRQREQLVSFLATHLHSWYQRVSGETQQFSVRLNEVILDKDILLGKLAGSFESEARYGYTLYGPHRDDLEITVKDRSVTTIFSQGQTRLLVIALKLATHAYLEKITGEKPLLLVDEVLSELDDERQRLLLESLPEAQTLLTCTAVPDSVRRRSNTHLLDLQLIMDDVRESRESQAVQSETAVSAREAAMPAT